MDNSQMANAGSFKKGEKRPGQGKRGPGKVTAEIKDMIRQALDEEGGVTYLRECARDPRRATAFLSLVGKVLPLQLTGGNGRTLAEELAGLRDED